MPPLMEVSLRRPARPGGAAPPPLATPPAAKGEHLGYSEWHEVDQARVNMFADATGDHQWIHVDQERAKSGPFGTTIAHGFWTLSTARRFLRSDGGVQIQLPSRMGVNYGLNRVRFPTPVRVGSRIR